MQITEIKKIGKGERYSIFIDDIFNGTLEAEILVKEKLKTGDEISEERLKQIKLDNGKLAAFSRAISYIEKGLHTEKQLRAYLKEKGFLPESIDEAIEKLLEYGYIDDALYAESFINSYKHKKGKIKLKFELRTKGVSPEIIDEKLEELLQDDETEESARNLLQKYLKNKTFDAKTKQKAYAHLMSKGFESDVVSRVLSEVKYESGD